MASKRTLIVVCKRCGHRKTVTLALRESSLRLSRGVPSYENMRPIAHRFVCSVCGEKDVGFEFRNPTSTQPKYVASAKSADLVFHRPTCGWMRHVQSDSEIAFPSREAAIGQGYSPCKSCRP